MSMRNSCEAAKHITQNLSNEEKVILLKNLFEKSDVQFTLPEIIIVVAAIATVFISVYGPCLLGEFANAHLEIKGE